MHHTGIMTNAYRITRHILAALLTVLLILPLAACGAGSGSGAGKGGGSAADIQDAGKIVRENDKEVTVIDQAGREVTVPKGVKSIAVSYRVVLRFIISLGDGDKITGVGKSEDFVDELAPNVRKAADVGKGVPDLEAVAELEPDVFFHKATDPDGLDAVQDLGIPAVGLSFEDPDDMKTALTIMGAVLDRKERADELISYYERRVSEDEKKAGEIENKKSAIVMGSSIGKVADGGMLQSRMIELAGGISCAADMEATELWPTAGTEQIFAWDPDFIFITGSESAGYTPEDIYRDPAWSELKAVRDRHVYVMPAEKDSWEFPGVVSVLGIDYMKSVMYPELLDQKQLQKNIDEFYELSYGRTFSGGEIGY